MVRPERRNFLADERSVWNRFHLGYRIAAPSFTALSYDHPGAGAAEYGAVTGG